MYLLESSVALAFFYLLYFLVLRRETFFSLNRFFLMGILVFSLLFPLLSFDFNPANVAVIEQPIEKISKFRMSYYDAMASWEFDSRSADPMNRTSGSYISSSSFDWKSAPLMFKRDSIKSIRKKLRRCLGENFYDLDKEEYLKV